LPQDAAPRDPLAWWQQFDDPLLDKLIAAAQEESPTLSSATAHIASARAAAVAAGAAALPNVQASAQVERGRDQPGGASYSTAVGGLQASWELDLFGGLAATRQAAQARLGSARSSWHEARIALAAEVGSSYVSLRACEAQLAIAGDDAASRAQTARLVQVSAQFGVQSPAQAALARASAAQGTVNVVQQRVQCEVAVKALVALTAIDEPTLRSVLAPATGRVPAAPALAVPTVPAALLAQRPDLDAAALDLAAASADIAEADAQRLPRVTLAGRIGPARTDFGAVAVSGTVWSVGPVTVSLPVFDGGARRANAEAARARYDEAASRYRGRLRDAVREVEQALATLAGNDARHEAVQEAARGFRASFVATEARQRGGLASVFELEDARRSDLQAQLAIVELQRERSAAWITLYRAVGGDWRAAPDSNP
jgi:NodT family efflux transporter outer membrane factor (OMF) lipoprotein